MAAEFPIAAYTPDPQDTGNDVPGDDTIANAANYNKHDEEIDVITQELRKGSVRAFHNSTGSVLNLGTLVFIDGHDATSDLPTVAKAKANAASTLAEFVVIATVANGANGNMSRSAHVTGLSSTSGSVGDPLYLDPTTPGDFTNTAPSGANFAQFVGRVTELNATVEFYIDKPTIPDKIGIEYGALDILQLKDLGVVAAKIAALAVTAAKLATDSVETAKIKNANVTPAKISGPFADEIPTLAAITKDAEGDTGADNIEFTIQLQDLNAGAFPRRATVDIRIATSAFGVPGGTQTVTVTQGVLLKVHTTDQYLTVESDANGTIKIRVNVTGGPETRHLMASIYNESVSLQADWVA